MDDRLKTLAGTLVNYSCAVQTGENVLISVSGYDAMPLIRLIVKEVYRRKARPFVEIRDASVSRELLLGADKELIERMAEFDAARMSKMQAYISVGANPNSAELSDIHPDIQKLYDIHYTRPVHYNIRIKNTRWVVLRYPTNSMAQHANMSLEQFEDFYFNVCNLDYRRMSDAMDCLVSLMNRTDRVRIIGRDTELSFSIKDIPAVKCAGRFNIPDGEVYTAPVKNSVNGVVRYNVASEYNGVTHENVRLTFKDGRITEFSGNFPEKLRKIFDTDNGARYTGEFALGVNPYIKSPMKNTLFDEKIAGSFHLTPGQCYADASNGNESAIHWDLIAIQTAKYGGGEIYFDNVPIRRDGVFVHKELLGLNPENLS